MINITEIWNTQHICIIRNLEDRGYTYTYVMKAGREGQVILKDKEEIIKNSEYMSLIIARKEEE